jgi:hypothetical protein
LAYAYAEGLRKIPENGKTIFCFSEIFLKSPPIMRSLHFETTPAEIKTISRIRRHRTQVTEFQISRQLCREGFPNYLHAREKAA